MSWQSQAIARVTVLWLSYLLMELMTCINQWLERGPKCGGFQLAASEGRDPGPEAPDLCLLQGPSPPSSDVAAQFQVMRVSAVSPGTWQPVPQSRSDFLPRLNTEVHWGDGPVIRPMLVPLAAAWQGQEAPAAPRAKAMLYSRKGARAWWAETVPKMITKRPAGLRMRWKGTKHFIIRIKRLSHFCQNKGIRLRLNDKPTERTKWDC